MRPVAASLLISVALIPFASRVATAQRGSALPAHAQRVQAGAVRARIVAHVARADSLGLSPRAAMLAISRDRSGTAIVDAFVRAPRGAERALRARGFRVDTRAGEWLTVRVPISRLRELTSTPGVRSIELARRATYSGVVPPADIVDVDASAVRTRTVNDEYEGSAGRGAIIGFVDSGIDFTHPDFLEDDTGRSRILYLWDQTLDGPGPGMVDSVRFDYGVECQQADLGATGRCPSVDTDGHGTHVAGIAAGDGSGAGDSQQDFAYTGVAPAANLIVVKTDLSFASIVDGVNYIFRRAAELGRPAVVNLSLGSEVGPHNGDAAPSLALDALTGPGRIIVAAAGNDGNNGNASGTTPSGSIHADGVAALGDSIVFTFDILPYTRQPGAANDLLGLQAYYPATDSFSVSIVRPDGTRLNVGMDAGGSSNGPAGGIIAYNGTAVGDSVLGTDLELGTLFPASPTNLAEFFLGEWAAGGVAPGSGEWRVVLHHTGGSGAGNVDAYLTLNTLLTSPLFAMGATNRRLIGPPGDGRHVITVGAHATVQEWRSEDGSSYQFVDHVPLGDLLDFSSPGPTRDGRLKPELSAPGRVFSSLSHQSMLAIQPDLRPLVATDSMHVMLQGTSMAAPHVAGAVALLLASHPTLTPAQVLSALTSGARQDAFTAHSYAGDVGSPNDSWGYGKLDVAASLPLISRGTGRAMAAGALPVDTQVTRQSDPGSVIPLQSLRLTAADPESLSVARIGALITGVDRGARLGVVVDANHDGQLSDGEEPVALSAPSVLSGTAQYMAFTLPSRTLVVPRGGVADVLLVAVLDGSSPNGTRFSGDLVADSSETIGLRTGTTVAMNGKAPTTQLRTTLLAEGERMNINQNPVRAAPLIINFNADPLRVEVYDFAGRLVRSFDPSSLTDARMLQWDLTANNGRAVANGVYMLVLDLPSGIVRQKLFVLR